MKPDNPAPFEARCYQLSINAWLTAGILLIGAITLVALAAT